MSSTSRRKNSSVVEQLLHEPHAYSFFQAVRLLERATLWESRSSLSGNRLLGGRNPIAGFAPPATETLRLLTQSSFKFPEAEIQSISRNNSQLAPPWQMRVNFMSLTGCMGVI